MRMRLYLSLGGAALLVMALFPVMMARAAEKLAKEDGTVSATVLPLDAVTAKRKFETATFGLG